MLQWLGDEHTARALGVVGAVIAGVITAAWAIFKQLRLRNASESSDAFLTLKQYQELLRSEQARIANDVEASRESEREELKRRQQELSRKLGNIEIAYSDALKQNEELSKRLDELSRFADRSDFENGAEALRAMRLDDALANFTNSLTALSPILKDAAASYLGLAIVNSERGDWVRAAENYSAALLLNEDEYTLGQASKFLWLAGNPSSAIHLSKKLLQKSISRTGRASESTASVLNLLSGQLYEIGEYGEARSLLTESLSILDQLGENKGVEYGSTLANLANVHLVEGEYGAAENLLRRALPLLSEEQDADVALAARNNLAEVLRLQGHTENSLILLNENLASTIKAFGRLHPHTSRALNFLGKAQSQAGNPEEALRSFLDAFEIQEECLGAFHHNTISIAGNVIYLVDNYRSLQNPAIDEKMLPYRKFMDNQTARSDTPGLI